MQQLAQVISEKELDGKAAEALDNKNKLSFSDSDKDEQFDQANKEKQKAEVDEILAQK